ncbi:hypothetical protein GOB86_06365 [Acetobacter lambici]|uniref:Transposase n=1 Tax=Acetobacter lambici TaxID=1332824 RepID=A0ABT1EZC3_9PROT|nr:hypothetical protein [Acetobacter lambici]MCP1242273.1 hypothetical protein [Acetobacter lambici]MCP1258290.1 hypothetical protein [Acetobacter lambici]NHO56692.1 hypothetical protein [Acetobacter lambici]
MARLIYGVEAKVCRTCPAWASQQEQAHLFESCLGSYAENAHMICV